MSKLKFTDFLKIKPMRRAAINDATSDPTPYEFSANEVARLNHPKCQYVIITKIDEVAEDMKRYTFIADIQRGTERLAPYMPGQYVSVKYAIGKIRTTRPYSICSANGEYAIAIKRDPKGLTSTYAHDNWEIGTRIELSAPEGWFVYEPIRDCHNVVALAGGSGITPFFSLAKSLDLGLEDLNLTLIYGARNVKNIAFKQEFDEIAARCPKFKVIYVLSDEEAPGYEHGFITKELIDKYTPKEETSYFVCGPKAMYDSVLATLRGMGVDRRHIRCEIFGEAHNIKEFDDCPTDLPETVQITIKVQNEVQVITGDPHKTVMRNIEDAGLLTLSKCRSGVCGYCHSSLIEGTVYIPKVMNMLREADKIYNQIHLCSAFPITDITIQVAKV